MKVRLGVYLPDTLKKLGVLWLAIQHAATREAAESAIEAWHKECERYVWVSDDYYLEPSWLKGIQ